MTELIYHGVLFSSFSSDVSDFIPAGLEGFYVPLRDYPVSLLRVVSVSDLKVL